MLEDTSKLLLACVVLLGLSQSVVHGFRLLGDPCSEQYPCVVLYSTCNNQSICVCETYHDVIDATLPETCDKKLQLGAPCNTSDNCSGGDVVECSVNNRCQCNLGFYDDNNSDLGGTCRNISEIMIRNVRVESVSETTMKFKWEKPVSHYDVFKYIDYVEMELKSTSKMRRYNRTLQRDDVTISKLKPGSTRWLTMIYVDTNSRDSIQYFRSPTATGTTNPAKPGELVNASQYIAPTIQIKWLPSNIGYADLYRVQLTDNDQYNRSIQTGNTTFSAEFTDLKPDTTYTVTIIAISGIQYNASESQPRVQLITTGKQYIHLGFSCNLTEQCLGQNVECSNSNMCQCKSGYYDDNNDELGGSCHDSPPVPPSLDGLSDGAKIAIGISVTLVTLLIVVAIIVYIRRRNAKRHFEEVRRSDADF